MKYCSKCGAKLKRGAHFCQACGHQVIGKEGAASSAKESVEPPRKVNKGDANPNIIKQKKKPKVIQVPFRPIEEKKERVEVQKAANQRRVHREEKEFPENLKGGIGKWISIYLALNIILLVLAPESDELLGSAIYAIIISLFLYFRRNKENPVHWILKIIIGLQAFLFIGLSIIFYDDIGFSIVSILLLMLIGINFKLLFR